MVVPGIKMPKEKNIKSRPTAIYLVVFLVYLWNVGIPEEVLKFLQEYYKENSKVYCRKHETNMKGLDEYINCKNVTWRSSLQ